MGQIKKYWVDKATGKYLTKNIDGQDHLLYKWVDGEPEIVYGALYNHWGVTDVKNIANTGWKVPGNSEWNELRLYFNDNSTAGGKLKETGTTYWNSPNTGATNDVGFNARGGGLRSIEGLFASIRVVGRIWSYAEHNINPDHGKLIYLEYNSQAAFFPTATSYSSTPKQLGYSVRLVKESTTLSHGEEGEYVGNDGTKYQTICIGTQEWLAENLIETKYRNGDTIPIVEDDIDWSNLTTGAMCYYDNDINNAYV